MLNSKSKNLLLGLYKVMPVFIQTIMLNIKGFMFYWQRGLFRLKKDLSNELKNKNFKTDYSQLKAFIKAASETPFWKERFSQFNIDIEALNLEEEIKKLPILTKSEVLENYQLIIHSKFSKGAKLIGTSGSTGTSLVFPETKQQIRKQWLVWWRYRYLNGIQPGTWMAWFGSERIVPIHQTKHPFWRKNFIGKQLMFSANHLNINTVER